MEEEDHDEDEAPAEQAALATGEKDLEGEDAPAQEVYFVSCRQAKLCEGLHVGGLTEASQCWIIRDISL